jgi:Amt family ammonium transporter
MLFLALWFTFAYLPMAHMVWWWGGPSAADAASGFIFAVGAYDFAGGTVVHINAGVAAVIAALAVGKRKDFGRTAMLPHNVPFALLGAALLYFGWFGFNAGSALAANGSAAGAFATTMLAPMATLCVWMALDAVRTQRATAVGAATAIVVGLVVITPAAGFVSPKSAIIMGALGALPSYYAILWRSRTRLDNSLDVLAGHGVGGMTGALLTGVFAEKALNGVADGLLFGNPRQLLIQAAAVLAALVYSAVVSFALLKLIALVLPLRATQSDEAEGLDITQHGEEAYVHGGGMSAAAAMETPRTMPSMVGVPTPSRS